MLVRELHFDIKLADLNLENMNLYKLLMSFLSPFKDGTQNPKFIKIAYIFLFISYKGQRNMTN